MTLAKISAFLWLQILLTLYNGKMEAFFSAFEEWLQKSSPFSKMSLIKIMWVINASRGWVKKKYTNKLPFYNYFKPNFIFHKTEVQTVILRCWTALYINWFKSYDKNEKHAKTQKSPKTVHAKFFFYKIALKRKWKKLHFVS